MDHPKNTEWLGEDKCPKNGLNWRIKNMYTARIIVNACLHYTVLQDTLEHECTAYKTG